jgi:hypothetical protein
MERRAEEMSDPNTAAKLPVTTGRRQWKSARQGPRKGTYARIAHLYLAKATEEHSGKRCVPSAQIHHLWCQSCMNIEHLSAPQAFGSHGRHR